MNKPTVILEAVASHDLWIWHAFFGMPGSHNDINVLHRSPLFANLAEGIAPEVNYTINGHDYNKSANIISFSSFSKSASTFFLHLTIASSQAQVKPSVPQVQPCLPQL